MEGCLELLDELNQIMKNEKGILSFGKNSSNVKSVIEDIETTEQKLESVIKQDESVVKNLENRYSTIKSVDPTGKAKTGSKCAIYAIIGIAAIMFIYMYTTAAI